MKQILFGLFVALISANSIFGQGNLTPSSAPAPTMKSLAQVEPRTLIAGGTNSVSISQPGSYYLTGDLEVTGAHLITVTTGHVTIDLNGFSLVGSGAGSGSGVLINSNVSNVVVFNGTIRNCTNGVNGAGRLNVRAEKLRVFANVGTGIDIGDGGAVIDCISETNGVRNIRTGASCIIKDCQANFASGTFATGIETGANCVITGCVATGNTGDGISTSFRSRVANCTANSNIGSGIAVVAGCLVTDCVAGSNGGDGITAPSNAAGLYIARCNVTLNTGDGIECGGGCVVEQNLSRSNGNGGGDGAGIHITNVDTRVDGNTVIANDRGIDIDFSGCLIIRNHATANGINYVIIANNRFGPIVDISAASSSPNISGSAAASTVSTTDPSANFSY